MDDDLKETKDDNVYSNQAAVKDDESQDNRSDTNLLLHFLFISYFALVNPTNNIMYQ